MSWHWQALLISTSLLHTTKCHKFMIDCGFIMPVQTLEKIMLTMAVVHVIKISELFLFLDKKINLYCSFPRSNLLSMRWFFMTKILSFYILLSCCIWKISYFMQLRCISKRIYDRQDLLKVSFRQKWVLMMGMIELFIFLVI